MEDNIKYFLIQSKNTDKQEINAYINYYKGLNVTTSFGHGGGAYVTWISFTGDGQTTQNGIYPVLLYYKSIDLLILAYGISVKNNPSILWTLTPGVETIEEYLIANRFNPKKKDLNKYLNSYVYKAYKLGANYEKIIPNIVKDLDALIGDYKKWLTSNGLKATVAFKAPPSHKRLTENDSFNYGALQAEVKRADSTLVGSVATVASSAKSTKVTVSSKVAGKTVSTKIPVTPVSVYEAVRDSIKKTELIYEDSLIKRLFYSLLTKPFVILSGLSGSGKTQLAISFAKSLVENQSEQICVVPVGADWTNREPLLGYPNSLVTNEYCRPENKALDLVINANNNLQKPYFLILDEMNLSYVERYFADFLSAMESRMEIHLWKGTDPEGTPHSITLSKNVFIIGTINVDETTYMFSPKVLDRASVIEFKVKDDELQSFLTKNPSVDVELANGGAKVVAEDFVNLALEKTVKKSKGIDDILLNFFKELKKVNAEFGYRSASEICKYVNLYAPDEKDASFVEAVDSAIIQKLLPKLHGSRKKIVPILEQLWLLCEPGKKLDELDPLEVPADTKYKLSADKILRMYKSALDNGFTSFAEA